MAADRMIRFQAGAQSIYLNPRNIVAITQCSYTNDLGHVSKITTTKFGTYYLVDGSASDNAKRVGLSPGDAGG